MKPDCCSIHAEIHRLRLSPSERVFGDVKSLPFDRRTGFGALSKSCKSAVHGARTSKTKRRSNIMYSGQAWFKHQGVRRIEESRAVLPCLYTALFYAVILLFLSAFLPLLRAVCLLQGLFVVTGQVDLCLSSGSRLPSAAQLCVQCTS